MDVSDIFNFFCSGEGKGVQGTRKRGGGVRLSMENPRKGAARRERVGGGGGEGLGRPSAGNLGGGGGGG